MNKLLCQLNNNKCYVNSLSVIIYKKKIFFCSKNINKFPGVWKNVNKDVLFTFILHKIYWEGGAPVKIMPTIYE